MFEILTPAKRSAAGLLTKLNRELLGVRVIPLADANSEIESFSAWGAVQKVVKQMEASALLRRIEIRYKARDTETEIYAMRITFEEIIGNLLDNAIKYSGQLRSSHAWIDIEQKRRSDLLIISISSWGSVIDIEDKQEIVKRGVRGTKANRPGYGIGLAIVEQNVRLLGGSFEIKPMRVGKNKDAMGSGPFGVNTVEVRFPIRTTSQIEHN